MDWFETYMLTALCTAWFIYGVYVGRADKGGDLVEVMWSLILGAFWPITIAGIASYPLWRKYTND